MNDRSEGVESTPGAMAKAGRERMKRFEARRAVMRKDKKWCLTYASGGKTYFPTKWDAEGDAKCNPGSTVARTREEDLRIGEMAEDMDEDAEQINAHDLTGIHSALAVILVQEVGAEAARRVIRRLWDYRGFQGMFGICCGNEARDKSKKAERDLNINTRCNPAFQGNWTKLCSGDKP